MVRRSHRPFRRAEGVGSWRGKPDRSACEHGALRKAHTHAITHADSTVQYSTVQYSTVQYSTVQYSTVQYSTAQHSTAQHSAVQYSTVQYSTVQHSTVQYSTVQYSTVQHNTAQHSTAGHDVRFQHTSQTNHNTTGQQPTSTAASERREDLHCTRNPIFVSCARLSCPSLASPTLSQSPVISPQSSVVGFAFSPRLTRQTLARFFGGDFQPNDQTNAIAQGQVLLGELPYRTTPPTQHSTPPHHSTAPPHTTAQHHSTP